MPAISLIIPLYNAEKYLRPCLDSVKNQTFEDMEVICINDGSTDMTSDIVNEYVAEDSRFRLIEQENAGCSMARNHGLKSALSPYVALLDQDDVLHPQAMEVLYHLITKYNADVAEFTNQTVADEFELKNPPHYDIENIPAEYSQDAFHYWFRKPKGGSVLVWNRLYKKDAIAGIEFPKDIQPAEDTIFTLKVMYQVVSIVHTDTKLLYYRDSSTSVMNQGKTDKYVRVHAAAGQVLYDYFLNSNRIQNKQDYKLLEKYITRFIFKSVISQPLRRMKDKETRLQSLEKARELAISLYEEGALKPELLGWRKARACKLFFNGHYGLAKILV